MKIETDGNRLVVTREKGDKGHYGVKNAAGESSLLHAVKQELNSHGHDFIKKRMWKDGHLVDEYQQYLRMRKPDGAGRVLAIYNPWFAIEGAEVVYNDYRPVRFALTDLAGSDDSFMGELMKDFTI